MQIMSEFKFQGVHSFVECIKTSTRSRGKINRYGCIQFDVTKI